jgi:hypothetical protein
VGYQPHDGGRGQRAAAKAGVVSESIHPAIMDSQLLVDVHNPPQSADPLAQVITTGHVPRTVSGDMLVIASEDAKEDYVLNGMTPAYARKLPDRTAS